MDLIPDDEIKNPKRILFVSGKMYYELFEYRKEQKIKDVSIAVSYTHLDVYKRQAILTV